ncbi:MAG: 2-oxoglutarate dehydrogenase E1 subunit family protein, partial [Thiotrichaceae bacterium]
MNKGDGQAQAWGADTQLDGNSVLYLEEMYERYLSEPNAVPDSWKQYFDGLPKVNGNAQDTAHAPVREYFKA